MGGRGLDRPAGPERPFDERSRPPRATLRAAPHRPRERRVHDATSFRGLHGRGGRDRASSSVAGAPGPGREPLPLLHCGRCAACRRAGPRGARPPRRLAPGTAGAGPGRARLVPGAAPVRDRRSRRPERPWHWHGSPAITTPCTPPSLPSPSSSPARPRARERLAIEDELLALGPPNDLVGGPRFKFSTGRGRAMTLLILGDRTAFEAECEAIHERNLALRLPGLAAQLLIWRNLLALLDGQWAEIPAHAAALRRTGPRRQPTSYGRRRSTCADWPSNEGGRASA